MKRMVTTGFAIGVFATGAFAQTPQPRAEHARLGSFVGTWNVEGEEEGIKYTMRETCEWFSGGFFLVCRREGTGSGPLALMKGQSILGYDSGEKAYTFYTLNSFGNSIFMQGTFSGLVWTFNGESRLGGELAKVRITITERSPTVKASAVEASFGGAAYAVLEQGRHTKVP